MKASEKKMIIILIIVSILIIGGINLIIRSNQNKQPSNDETNNVVKEEFVNVLEDGTKVNISEKLHQEKTIDGLKITDLQLTEKGNQTVLLGTVTNTTTQEKTKVIKIKLVDKTGKEIVTLNSYIEGIKPGETKDLIVYTTLDYANAYDFIVSE